MAKHQIEILPVVDKKGNLVGTVSVKIEFVQTAIMCKQPAWEHMCCVSRENDSSTESLGHAGMPSLEA